jgi:hypothetical protein
MVQDSVICHFFGGPWDGRELVYPNAPTGIYVARLEQPIYLGVDETTPDSLVSTNDILLYTRRSPALEGHAYYDYNP